MKSHKHQITGLIFFALLAGLFFFFGFNRIFFDGPGGIHFIRQVVSLSFSSQYYNHGFEFFSPRLFNLESIDARAVSEFPLLYYITAILYSVFGEKMYLLKILILIISYAGLYFVYKISVLLLKDHLYAILVSLFLATSTVFNYYSFNYLPDPAALGLTFAGWYLVLKFELTRKKSTLIVGFLCFTLGSLMKVSYLINPLAVLVYYLISIVLKKEKFNKAASSILIWAITGTALVFLWNVYVLYYNAKYQSGYFTTSANPLWSLPEAEISLVRDYIINYWRNAYLPESSFHFLAVIFLSGILLIKKSTYRISMIMLILMAGTLAYLILFYAMFKDHDYYFLVCFPLVLFILLNGIQTLQNTVKNRWFHAIIKIAMGIIVVTGINYSRMKLEERYELKEEMYSETAFMIRDEAAAIGELTIPDEAKFIVAPDLTKNGGLLYLRRQGWTIRETANITPENIKHLTGRGAQYLLLATRETGAIAAAKATGELIYDGEKLSIYKLNSLYNRNFRSY